MTRSPDSQLHGTESGRHIVEVRDIMDQTALCPAEAILHEYPEGELRGYLYPAARLEEGEYVLRFGSGESWPVLLRPSDSLPPPAMVILSDPDPPTGGRES